MIDRGNYVQWYEKGHYESETRAWKDTCVSGTLTTSDKTKIIGGGYSLMNNLRIRKLTPKECARLQGLKDSDTDKILKNQSNASAYHLFGDSICIPVMMALFGQLLDIDWEEKLQELYNEWR